MGQEHSTKRNNFNNLQVYSEGKCESDTMCKNLNTQTNQYVSPAATCNRGRCNCGNGFKQLDGSCCKDVVYDNAQKKYVCDKNTIQSCPNHQTCKNMDFGAMKFTCPAARCTKNGCDCGPRCKNFEGTCCKDVLFDEKTNEYKCKELTGYGYKPKKINTKRIPEPYTNIDYFANY